MTLVQRIRFYQQLAVLARAGIPLRSSLERLRERIPGRELKVLSEKVGAGESIGEAFAAARFSPFECHLVTAGERSARLEIVFQHLSEFWTRQRQLHQALLQPLYYPIAVLHLAIIVGALTHLLNGTSSDVVVSLIVGFATLYTAGFALYMLIRASWESEAAQRFWLALPIIGKTLSAAYAYRWITAVRLEYSAGIPLPDAVADAWRASGYEGGDRLAAEGEQALRDGAELSTLVQRWRRLPRDWVDFIETGEVSGALETAFENLEAEAARASALAQQRMTDWVPKITYFLVLLVVAAMVGSTLYRVIVSPITEVENQLGK